MPRDRFDERREEGNRAILDEGNLSLRRFFALDHDVYADGALPRKVKELQGLVASAVLRCEDCISYHLRAARGCGATRREVVESFAVALVVGGSAVIPALRHAFAEVEALWPGESGAEADRSDGRGDG